MKNVDDNKAILDKLRNDTFGSVRATVVAFFMMILSVLFTGLFEFLTIEWMKVISIFFVFVFFSFIGMSVVSTVAYVTHDKMGSTIPLIFIGPKTPVRIADTEIWRRFIMKDFIDGK